MQVKIGSCVIVDLEVSVRIIHSTAGAGLDGKHGVVGTAAERRRRDSSGLAKRVSGVVHVSNEGEDGLGWVVLSVILHIVVDELSKRGRKEGVIDRIIFQGVGTVSKGIADSARARARAGGR